MSSDTVPLELGVELRSDSRTITETDLVMWASLMGDWNPVHMDIEHAKRSPFGQRIVHGNVAFNLAVALSARCHSREYRPEGYVRQLGWQGVRFTAPVFLGDTLHVCRTLRSREDRTEGTVCSWSVEMLNQRDEVVMVGTEQTLVADRPEEGG